MSRAALVPAVRGLSDEAATGRLPLVWISKGYPFAAELVRRLDSRVPVIADFDDHDIRLAREFVAEGVGNRLRLHPLRPGSPERVARAQKTVVARADAFTSASDALAASLGLPPSTVRVPHARPDLTVEAGVSGVPRSGRTRIGFMGTMRAHKGFDELVAALRGDPALELVTFAQAGMRAPAGFEDRWRTLAPDTPLSQAYAQVDVAVLPMSRSSAAADLQLPAKAIDAAAASTPIAATPTTVLEEYFAEHLIRVDDWSQLGRLLGGPGTQERLARAGAGLRSIWQERLSVDVVRGAVGRMVTDGLGLELP